MVPFLPRILWNFTVILLCLALSFGFCRALGRILNPRFHRLSSDEGELLEGAKAVLANNWLGTRTLPSPNLYPFQWSWDSCFIAIGKSYYDQLQARTELRSLFDGMWSNGLLPHIIFNASVHERHFSFPISLETDSKLLSRC